MGDRKGLLSNLVIEEIALCERGMNPRADMVVWKADEKKRRRRRDRNPCKPGIQRADLGKQGPFPEGDDPGRPLTFSDAMEDVRAMDIDQALDARLHALLHTTTWIMRAEGIDREAAVLQAVNDYAETMQRDVPELFAGRLAKMLGTWAAEGPLLDDPEIVRAVKEELDAVGLADDVKKGENMDWLNDLTKEERAALDFVLGGTDPAEFFTGTTDEQGAFVAKLVKRAVEASDTDAELAKVKTQLSKAQAQGGEEGIEALIAKIDDPDVRNLVEIQRADAKKSRDEIADLRKAARRREIVDVAKGFDCLPNEGDALVDVLEKADKAGILDDLKKILASANAQAKVAKQLGELGVDTILGEGSVGTPDEAHEALVAKASEIRKAQPELSAEQAYDRAITENPDLYRATRGAPQASQLN